MSEQNWANPNEPREGSRRSTRKRVFKEPTVIRHRLLLGPTLARRKARKRRKEQERNETRAKKRTMNDESSSGVTRKEEIRRKLGPHNLNTADLKEMTPDNVLSKQTPPSTTTIATDTPRPVPVKSSLISQKKQVEASPKQSKPKERKKKSTKISEPRPSEVAGTIIDLTRAPTPPSVPTTIPSISTKISPPSASSALSTSLLLRNPSTTAALVSPIPVGLSSLMTMRTRQMLEDSNTLQLLRKREHAVLLMQRSTDMSSIIASSRLVREFHGGSVMDPTTQVILEDAEGRGMLLLSKLLIGTFAKPILLGGLGFSLAKAQLLADEIVVSFADVIGKVDLSSERLMGLRILPHDAVLIAPILRLFGTAIEEKSLAFRQEIILKCETSCFGRLPMIPTTSSALSPLSLGIAALY